MRGFVLFCVLVLVVVACGDGEAQDQSAGCAEPLVEPGEYEGLNVLGDVEQPYWMVVPESYADVAPAPLYLHLAGGSGDHNVFLEGWRPYLGNLQGLMAIVNTAGSTRQSPEIGIALIDQINENYCVDPSRIHVMGGSSSSLATDWLACEAADRIASFAAVIGGGLGPEECTPSRPVPLWTFTGDVDRYVVTRLVEKWVDLNGCDPDPIVDDLGSGVFRKTYQDCEADIVFYDIEGMGHMVPTHEPKGPGAGYAAKYDEVDYLEAALQFFADHPLP